MTHPIPPLPKDAVAQHIRVPVQRAAKAFEASFLAEMLKFSGLGEQTNSFSGSAGEAQFASFHREALAQAIVSKGGLGLAEMIAASLKEPDHDD